MNLLSAARLGCIFVEYNGVPRCIEIVSKSEASDSNSNLLPLYIAITSIVGTQHKGRAHISKPLYRYLEHHGLISIIRNLHLKMPP